MGAWIFHHRHYRRGLRIWRDCRSCRGYRKNSLFYIPRSVPGGALGRDGETRLKTQLKVPRLIREGPAHLLLLLPRERGEECDPFFSPTLLQTILISPRGPCRRHRECH